MVANMAAIGRPYIESQAHLVDVPMVRAAFFYSPIPFSVRSYVFAVLDFSTPAVSGFPIPFASLGRINEVIVPCDTLIGKIRGVVFLVAFDVIRRRSEVLCNGA